MGLFDELIDHRLEVPGPSVGGQLAVGAGPLVQDRVDVLGLGADPQLVEDIVQQLEQLRYQLANGSLLLLAEVDQPALDAVADGPPLVLVDQMETVEPPRPIRLTQLDQLGDDAEDEGRYADRFVDLGTDVADPELECREPGVGPDVPADLGGLVDAAGLDQSVDVALMLAPGAEGGG